MFAPDPDQMAKVQPPVGFWDPLGLSSDGDLAVFKRRREVELKHGRSQSRMQSLDVG